jgi:hypothetical protein
MIYHTKNFSYKPEKGTSYFRKVDKFKYQKDVAVILPFFNEEDTYLFINKKKNVKTLDINFIIWQLWMVGLRLPNL